MAVVERTIDILGDETFTAVILGKRMPAGYPVDIYDDDVTVLKTYALGYCAGIETVNFPNVEKVGTHAFLGCPDLKRVYFPAATTVNNGALRDCPKMEEINLPLAATVGDYAFLGDTSLKTITLPSVTSVSTGIFFSCNALEEAIMPKLKTVGANTYYGCSAMKQIDLPSATSIGGNVFVGCRQLEVINIGPNIKTIANTSFSSTPDGLVINLAVAEGAVSGAPWGAPNAIINYEVPYSGKVPMPES